MTAPHGAACETAPQRPDSSGASAWMGSCLPSLRIRAGAWVLAVTCLCLEESIESPARSGLGPARSNRGLRQPCRVQMVSKFGGMQSLPCPRAFIVAVTGGAMEPGPSYTFDAFRLEPPPGGLWRGDVRIALRPRPLAMLRYLVAHAGRLVTKAEL